MRKTRIDYSPSLFLDIYGKGLAYAVTERLIDGTMRSFFVQGDDAIEFERELENCDDEPEYLLECLENYATDVDEPL